MQFKVGDLVMAYLNKDRIPIGNTQLMMKRIWPCRVVHKYGKNAHEIELPPNIAISPIFNVCDLSSYKNSVIADTDTGEEAKAAIKKRNRKSQIETKETK